MKRILVISVILAAMLLVGCASPATSPTQTQQAPTSPPTKTAPAPTQTPTPTLTPLPGYSRSNPVGIGAPLNIKVNSTGGPGSALFPNEYEVRVTLLEFIRGAEAWQRVAGKAFTFNVPKAGFEYILVRVRFNYLSGPGPDKTFDVSPVWFKVISGKGQEYSTSTFDVSPPDPGIRTSLYPGASHEGWMAFSISQDDTSPLMTLGREYDGTGGIWFKLY
jgi:hypothetical protein